MSAIEDIGEGYSIDTDEFLKIIESLVFFYEHNDIFWCNNVRFDRDKIKKLTEKNH